MGSDIEEYELQSHEDGGRRVGGGGGLCRVWGSLPKQQRRAFIYAGAARISQSSGLCSQPWKAVHDSMSDVGCWADWQGFLDVFPRLTAVDFGCA